MDLAEFLQDGHGRSSLSRLLCFLAFWPATTIVCLNAHSPKIDDILMVYLGSFVLGYAGGKFADVFIKKEAPDVATAPDTDK